MSLLVHILHSEEPGAWRVLGNLPKVTMLLSRKFKIQTLVFVLLNPVFLLPSSATFQRWIGCGLCLQRVLSLVGMNFPQLGSLLGWAETAHSSLARDIYNPMNWTGVTEMPAFCQWYQPLSLLKLVLTASHRKLSGSICGFAPGILSLLWKRETQPKEAQRSRRGRKGREGIWVI